MLSEVRHGGRRSKFQIGFVILVIILRPTNFAGNHECYFRTDGSQPTKYPLVGAWVWECVRRRVHCDEYDWCLACPFSCYHIRPHDNLDQQYS